MLHVFVLLLLPETLGRGAPTLGLRVPVDSDFVVWIWSLLDEHLLTMPNSGLGQAGSFSALVH